MLLVLEDGAVPVLEDLAEAVVVLQVEAVELDDARAALQDAHLVALGGPAPLRAANVAVVEGEGVAAAGGFPAKARLCEPALATLLGEIKVDAVEALTENRGQLAGSSRATPWCARRGTHMAVILAVREEVRCWRSISEGTSRSAPGAVYASFR